MSSELLPSDSQLLGDNRDHQSVMSETPELSNGDFGEKIFPRVAELRVEATPLSGSSDQDSDAELASDDSKSRPYVPLSEEALEKVRNQVEFYFSDSNIVKDAFLLKHIRRHKEGYVSLKLIASFRKIKSLTKDFRHVIEALRLSKELEINAEGTKIRRRQPLPELDETFPTRTIIAFHLPMDNPTIEQISQIFSSCGDISLIRILRPGKQVPTDVGKFLSKHPELNSNVCAVVEFEKEDSASQACKTLENTDNWRSGMRVSLLAKANSGKGDSAPNDKNSNAQMSFGKNKIKDTGAILECSSVEKDVGGGGDAPKVASEGLDTKRSRRSKGKRSRRQHGGSTHASPAGRLDVDENWRENRSSLSPSGNYTPGSTPQSSPYSSPRSSPKVSPNVTRRRISHGTSPLAVAEGFARSPNYSPEVNHRRISLGQTGSDVSASPSGSPWVQRRLRAQADSASPLIGLSPGTSPLLGRKVDTDRLKRQPTGPDGTKGFYFGAGRGKIQSNVLQVDSPGKNT